MAHTDRSLEHAEDARKTILVIDDDTSVGEFLVEALKLEGPHQALLAANGIQALEILKTLIPDLILLDYQLPDIDGLELADHFQATDALKHVPLLLMSANVPKRELLSRQMNAIEKPFELDELLEAIVNCFTDGATPLSS